MRKIRPEVALTKPHSPIGLTLELGILWEELLERRGVGVRLLSSYPQLEVIPDIAEEARVMKKRRDEWHDTLKGTGGLVIACYNTRNIDWDRAIIGHIGVANDLGLPVFSQVDPAEVWKPPVWGEAIVNAADITVIGGNVEMVKDRIAT